MRNKYKNLKRIKKMIISAVVSIRGDNRLFAKTMVGGTEVTALLDSGATNSCIGRAATELLKGKEKYITKLFDESVKTANGGETAVTGVITLPGRAK